MTMNNRTKSVIFAVYLGCKKLDKVESDSYSAVDMGTCHNRRIFESGSG